MLLTEKYIHQAALWPQSGRHILAQADEDSVIVYQAYRPSIGEFAIEHGYFSGDFDYARMSWIKPNFLWMMYRSGWGTKQGQEIILAIRLRRPFFDNILSQAVESTFVKSNYTSPEEWERAIATSTIRIQWDPDHHPNGSPSQRRAIQLGLRGRVLKDYGRKEILEILDMSAFVNEQRGNISSERIAELVTPAEREYVPDNPAIRTRIGLD
jgi:hypothetical protein